VAETAQATSTTNGYSSETATPSDKKFWSGPFMNPLFYDWGLYPNNTFGLENGALKPDPVLNIVDSLEVKYPAGSRNPGCLTCVIGGLGVYALPLNITDAKSISFTYWVFFPKGFNFVKGGKLPGIYGGRGNFPSKREFLVSCSGGNAALDCFSSRFMFRTKGLGVVVFLE
jgi:hypothetical protein